MVEPSSEIEGRAFTIFEYFVITDNNKNKKLLSSDYNMILSNKIEIMSKISGFSYYDLSEFIDFIGDPDECLIRFILSSSTAIKILLSFIIQAAASP